MAIEDVSGAEHQSEARRTRSRSRRTKRSTSQTRSVTTRGEHSDIDKYEYERRKEVDPLGVSIDNISSSIPFGTFENWNPNRTVPNARALLRSTSRTGSERFQAKKISSSDTTQARNASKNRDTTPYTKRHSDSYVLNKSNGNLPSLANDQGISAHNSTPRPFSVTGLTTSKLIKVNHVDRPFICLNARFPFQGFGNILQGFESVYDNIWNTQLKNDQEMDRFMLQLTYQTISHKRSLRGLVNTLFEREESYEIPPVEFAWPATTDLRDFPLTRNMNRLQLFEWNWSWKKDCKILIGSVRNLTAEIDLRRRRLNGLREVLVEARNSAARARQEETNKTPLAIRIGQDIGLLTPDPFKLPAYDAFLNVLYPWITCASIQENLLTRVWNNLTDFDRNFTAKAAAVYSADVRASSVREWITQGRQ
ncbi:MAG: hypothetical protein Q9226_004167 [Calogaya cf. arnoldii]